jgi:hypothetical protein
VAKLPAVADTDTAADADTCLLLLLLLPAGALEVAGGPRGSTVANPGSTYGKPSIPKDSLWLGANTGSDCFGVTLRRPVSTEGFMLEP